MTEPIARARVRRRGPQGEQVADDLVVVEEPCEIRLQGESVAVVMRTPGHDRELAAGFLFDEGIVAPGDIGTIRSCRDPGVLDPDNVIDVTLVPGAEPRATWQRHFYATSSCGVCGKASIEAVRVHAEPLEDDVRVPAGMLARCMQRLRQEQTWFEATGGLHAAGLFDAAGGLVLVREDVGRHNALDKVIGHCYLHERLPLHGHLLVVSGRSSFEIVQKAWVARIPVVASVSAASSLAVQLAREANMTLAGFVRGQEMVVYTGAERIE